MPYAKAFVVHFSAETDARLERVTGRVEHLETGRRAAFASVVELLDQIVALLADTRSDSTDPAWPAPRRSRGPSSQTARGRGASA